MDTKRLLTSMLIAGILMVLFTFVFRSNSSSTATGPTTNAMFADLPAKPTVSEAGATTDPVTLGWAQADYPDKIAITVNPVTAAIDRAQLNVREYPQTVKGTQPLTLFDVADPDQHYVPGVRPFATLGIHITRAGDKRELGFGVIRTAEKITGKISERDLAETDSADAFAAANSTWVLDRQYLWKTEMPADAVKGKPMHDLTLLLTLRADNAPLAEITKTFHVDPASYEFTITHTVKNLTNQPLKVAIDQLGAPDFYRDDPRADDRFFHGAGLDSTKLYVTPDTFNLTQLELGKLAAGTRDIGQMDDFKGNPILWTASSNRFFAAIVRPLPETGSTAKFSLAIGHDISEQHHVAFSNVDLIKGGPKPADDSAILRYTGNTLEIPPGGSISEPLTVYMGPKNQEQLGGDRSAPVDSTAYAHAIFEYTKIIQFTRGCFVYSFCVSDTLVYAFLWALEFLKRTVAFGNYGLAIMILVVLIRAALHPLTRASQINMAKMGKKMKDVQPKIEAMKKKYADNKKKQSEEMMRIYRENKVNPAGGILGCLPMLLQAPIWAAAWSGVAFDINLRHASFIPGWINDLSNPDTILPTGPAVIGHPLFTLPVLGFDIYGLNLLPILLAAVLFINNKVTMASQPKPADDQQANMQKMSSYFIFVLPILFYNAPSGLNLYYFASTLASLVDTYFVRKSLKRQGILPASAAALPTHEENVE